MKRTKVTHATTTTRQKIRKAFVQLAEMVRLYLIGVTPHEIARRLGCSSYEIADVVERHRLRDALLREPDEDACRTPPGDPAACAPSIPCRPVVGRRRKVGWTEEAISWLGKRPDAELALAWGLHLHTVSKKRKELGIPFWRPPAFAWTANRISDLFLLTNRKFREKHGAPWREILARRKLHRVPDKPCGRDAKATFTANMLALLGKRPDGKLARGFLLDVNQIKKKRQELGIQSFRASRSPWTPAFLAKIGKVPDTVLAKEMGIGFSAVAKRRYKLGIAACTQYFKWTKKHLALLGTKPDAELAKDLGLSRRQVEKKRQERKIACFDRPRFKWTAAHLALLGTMSDEDAARALGVTTIAARSRRIREGIPAWS